MPPDAAPTAEPSRAGRTGGRTSGEPRRAAVPPPRPAPDVEAVPPERDDEHDGEPAPGAAPAASATADGLTERERGILDFEQQWWRHAGAKEQAIRDRFGLSATRYYQLLNALLDNPAALAAEPLLVGRLRRLRSSRARNRRR